MFLRPRVSNLVKRTIFDSPCRSVRLEASPEVWNMSLWDGLDVTRLFQSIDGAFVCAESTCAELSSALKSCNTDHNRPT